MSDEDVEIHEHRGARLMRRHDGSVYCLCPFACSACYEVCEFVPIDSANPQPWEVL